MNKFDVIIIGSGTAGVTLAGKFSQQNKTVALIEKDQDIFGGSCINTACIPTKSLVHDALNGIPYTEAIERKNKIVEKMHTNRYNALNKRDKIKIYDGGARFIANKQIEVACADGTKETLTAEHIVVNTGAKNNIPPIEGIENARNIYTSTTLIERTKLPEKLIIIGGGYIGLEYASMYATFGSEVTVILMEDELVPHEERVIAKEIQKELEAKGITFLFGTETKKITEKNEQITLDLSNDEELTGNAVLLATGRKPNIDSLQLEKTDIKTEKGAIKVNDKLETTVENVWAVGDVRGGLQFTYISSDDARIVIDHIFGEQKYTLKQRGEVQYTVFIDPPLSRVGLIKKAAVEAVYDVMTNEMPVTAVPAAHVIHDNRGLFTAVVDKKTKRILGASLFGPQSQEIINIVKIAIDKQWPYTELRDYMFNHPVMSEALNGLFSIRTKSDK